MSKKCARQECGKTVYPLEELNCLDKIWHKGCFKCTSCGMTLNMKNYKGYDKKPYCEPHYPKTVATAVVDTPEMQRVAQNTKLQSQHQYHLEYEKMKGTKIDIADDPELARHMQNTKNASLVQYTGEADKKIKQEQNRPKEDPNAPQSTDYANYYSETETDDACFSEELPWDSNNNNIEPSKSPNGTWSDCSSLSRNDALNPVVPGFVFPNLNSNEENFATTVWRSHDAETREDEPKKVGSIADYDPVNGNYGSLGSGAGAVPPSISPTPVSEASEKSSSSVGKVKKTKKTTKAAGFAVKCLYDYTAADADEISFKEGDVIVNCQSVDEGWMTGTHQKTLAHGMLPANYVEKIAVPTGQSRLS